MGATSTSAALVGGTPFGPQIVLRRHRDETVKRIDQHTHATSSNTFPFATRTVRRFVVRHAGCTRGCRARRAPSCGASVGLA